MYPTHTLNSWPSLPQDEGGALGLGGAYSVKRGSDSEPFMAGGCCPRSASREGGSGDLPGWRQAAVGMAREQPGGQPRHHVMQEAGLNGDFLIFHMFKLFEGLSVVSSH